MGIEPSRVANAPGRPSRHCLIGLEVLEVELAALRVISLRCMRPDVALLKYAANKLPCDAMMLSTMLYHVVKG